MNQMILVMGVVAFLISGACASRREAQQNVAEGKEGSAGDEGAGSRYRKLKSDPNWNSAEEAGEQLAGD